MTKAYVRATQFPLLLLISIILPASISAQMPELVPQPKSLVIQDGASGWKLADTLYVYVSDDSPLYRDHFLAVANAIELSSGRRLEFTSNREDASIRCMLNPELERETYRLNVNDKGVSIEASDIKGISHATATLLQLIGQIEGDTLPALQLKDQPDCAYRNLMIDLGRNAHSLECLKETIDLLWYYKLDSVQLHLTDDQRFAFPSKAFPKLMTEKGKITWEEFAELERYAQVRGVTIIPELEVPGHSTLLRKTYPEVFGKTSTDVAKLDSSRQAIKVLLDEMIELFPSSPYIHIGGDEAFGVPEDLQRDLINDLHAYLKSKGKKTLVWEGPRLGSGDNKVNEEVIHINWRTINFPADQMLDQGYQVVNAAWDPLYVVDHYPRINFTMASPEYIYQNLDLFRFKHFNPDIRTFGNPIRVEPNDRVIGFCMPWWEGREINYFPMIVPRIIPMAEVAWNAKQEKNFSEFDRRSITCEEIRRKSYYPISLSASPIALENEGVFHNQTTVTLVSTKGGDVYFTLDGSAPTLESKRYQAPIQLDRSATVRAVVFAGGKQLGHGIRKTFTRVDPTENLALGKPVTTNITSGPLFSKDRLTDGGTGNLDFFLGYPAEPKPIEITIDLGEVQEIGRIVTHAYFNGNTFESYELQISIDGKEFVQVANRRQKPEQLSAKTVHHFEPTNARYVRVVTNGCKGYVFDSFSKLTEIQVFAGDQTER